MYSVMPGMFLSFSFKVAVAATATVALWIERSPRGRKVEYLIPIRDRAKLKKNKVVTAPLLNALK